MSRLEVFKLLRQADSEVTTELLAEHGPNIGTLKPETASSIGLSQTENLIRHDGDVHKTVPSDREKSRNAVRAWLRERDDARKQGVRPPPCPSLRTWPPAPPDLLEQRRYLRPRAAWPVFISQGIAEGRAGRVRCWDDYYPLTVDALPDGRLRFCLVLRVVASESVS